MENKGKKHKGDNFERLMARRIGEWWEGDRDAFWRTSGSGSRAHRDDIHPGDIGPVKNLKTPFPFCIECRNRESWSIDKIFTSSVPDLLVWSAENIDVAGPNYLSLIIAKRKYASPLVIHPNWHGEDLSVTSYPSMGVYIICDIPAIVITSLEDFFGEYSPSVFPLFYEEIPYYKAEEYMIKKDIEEYLDSIRK